MADKSISELVAATAVGSTDLFVLEQTGTAKKLTGQILENWLVALADGHGGIQTIAKTGTSGLVDTYTITYADTTTSTFTVTNGKALSSITQYWAVSSSGSNVPSTWYTTRQTMTVTDKYLWSYMLFTYNDGTTSQTPKSVIGVYGDTGAQTYVWIKYAAIQPTSDADMGDVPDNWIGIYTGLSSTAPTSYTAYAWYEYKGEKGDTGDASTITSQSVTYMESSSGTVVPSGSWTTTVPAVTPGKFLWTRTILEFNDLSTVTAYSVSRFGIDGTGSVSTVNSISPDTNGNVALTATDIPMTDNTSVQDAINNKGRMYTTEPLTTLYANVASDEFEVFSAGATMTSQLTAGNYSGLSYGFAVFHPQNNLVEVLVMATGASKIYTCRITSDGTVSYPCDVGVTAVTSGKVLYYTGVAVTAGTGDIVNYSNTAITNEHVLAECVFANPSAITTNVAWTTTAGNLRLNGTCSSATTVNVVLIRKDN